MVSPEAAPLPQRAVYWATLGDETRLLVFHRPPQGFAAFRGTTFDVQLGQLC
jgi:hypothetical protein